ncbi:uncharacterized protein LOC117324845 [Pecten maximus]|uniref:uncharacterized protein LOC117324845 n=1 Tax=Pecten maximus TaxID=6579 RepID=UPI001457F3B7|nr:uncharacterized protein LOC117324845 [Pecten maximus]
MDDYESESEDSISGSSQQADNRSNSTSPVPPCGVQPLSSLAAQVTGEHYSCQFLENHYPPLEETMIKKVAFWAFPQSESRVEIYGKLMDYKKNGWRDGETLIEENRIMEITQVGFMVSAILSKTSNSAKVEGAKVTLSFEKQKVTLTTCSLCPQDIWCQHIVAVAIYRIRNADKIAVHAPVAEVLGTLNRDQMQKLLQYTISEDPGGVTCRVFKHIDSIRDSRSEVNKTQLAPDPTFGVCPDQKSCIDLSLAQLNQDFRDDVQRVSIRYPDTLNLEMKADSMIYRYFVKKVSKLVNSDEVSSAGRVLINMANTTLNEISTQRPSACLNRLFHDIERLFTCFIPSFKGQIREELIQTAIDINSITQNIDNPDRFITASEWSDLDSIPLENYISSSSMNCDDSSSQGVFGASRRAPFYQPLCASLLPDPPDSLDELLCGRQKPLTTSYEEQLPVMLLRFETLMHFGMMKIDKKLYNLGVVILRKLLRLSIKYSVIGCNKVLDSEASSLESDESENDCVSSAVPMKRSRKQKNRPKKKPCSVPRLETIEVDMEGMSKAQISYGLLYVCYTLYKIEDLVSLGLEGFPVILEATLRAMELGRFRAIAPEDTIGQVGERAIGPKSF